ncbi:MAG: transglycosylase domain-containing protein, partial [Acidobacteriota bacterium]|nr:transglycosylase domain-containing protein [Acidobacteriota bacterium]
MPAARSRLTPDLWRRLRWPLAALGVLLVTAAIFVIRPFWRLTSHFREITFHQPSRLYGQPTLLAAGRPASVERLVQDLSAESYRESQGGGGLPPGRYRQAGDSLTVHLRSFPLPDGRRGGGILAVRFHGSRIAGLSLNGRSVESAQLQPPLLASYYGPDLLERRPVVVDEVAEDLIESVVAAEDDSFFSHQGISWTGMARALWVDLRGGHIRQGGSTLTQQLVKNYYLTQERSVVRKGQEILLAVLLEMRYSKREILEAYLNEIYLGSSGGVNLMGVGAAARAYFGKDASQLDLAESATLAGMIPAPAAFSPVSSHAERAKERRDAVLQRLLKLGRLDPNRIRQALESPLASSPEPLVRRRAPYFADAMTTEAQHRFHIDNLADSGYSLFATLDLHDQQAAQSAVLSGLTAAEKTYEKGHAGLQAALVSIQPATGGILAYVGGRHYETSQFDRVSQAFRQSGSTFKPIVYAAAFEARRASPATFLEDEPITLRVGNRSWSPKNDDGSFHGWVTARTALEHSYNLATTRLALQVGLPRIVELAHRMGITSETPLFPSTALGATAIAPIELATVYATLAAGGVRPPVHGLVAVVDSHGKSVAGTALPEPEQALSPQSAYLVTSLLQGVLERGTGASVAAELRSKQAGKTGTTNELRGDLAGKTGTTNERRDTWFAGYAPERATVVWVGYDDNSVTRLSGARGALPIWSRFTVAASPPGGYSTFEQPPGIVTASIDPETGMLATEFCPIVFTEFFRQGELPTELCTRHQTWLPEEPAQAQMEQAQMEQAQGRGASAGRAPERLAPGVPNVGEDRDKAKRHPFRRWLRRIFGHGDDEGHS